jgi:N-acetylglucosaminyl-diphospho-decaprenol L-rhamnosyltransferase
MATPSALRGRCGAVVVAHSRVDAARRCVTSLRRWLPPNCIVLVVNSPAGIAVDEIAALANDAIVVSPLAPQGYGANLNLGVRVLPDDLETCVLANDDVVFEDGSVPKLVDCLATDTDIGVVGARLVDERGHDLVSWFEFPRLRDELDANLAPRYTWELGEERGPATRVEWVLGAAFAARLAAYALVRGFDEDFFLDHEDADFCRRIRRAGWSIAWCEDARVTHLDGGSIDPTLRVRTLKTSRRLFFRKEVGSVRWRAVQTVLAGALAVGTARAFAGSVVHPRTARRRFGQVADRWRNRLFL